MSLDRRQLLAGAAGLVVGVRLDGPGEVVAAGKIFAPNAWLSIGTDGAITVLVETPELGQGAHTYVPMMVAEELEAPLSAIRVEQAPTIPALYKNLRTGGSGGLKTSFTPMRIAGAQAREMLIAAAARRWRVGRADCRAEKAQVVHGPSGRRLGYGALAEAASRLPVPDPAGVVLKPPGAFAVLGRPQPRTDTPGKVDGSATFGIDVRLPGMLYAVIARSPTFGGRLRGFDGTAAQAVPGVRAVFAVPPLPRRLNTAGGVAVVAESTWAAIQGRKALTLDWAPGPGAQETTDSLRRQMQARLAGPATFTAVTRGDAAAALAAATTTLEAVYEQPFQAHATMEPMNTTVHVRTGEIEIWSPTQFAAEVQRSIADLAGAPPGTVIVHMTLSGGSFGRRYQWDYPAEAWQVARRVNAPVQLVWTREDDLQHDFYRPISLQRLRAGFDAGGRLIGWSTRIVTTPISGSNLYTNRQETPELLADPAVIAELEWFGSDAAPYAAPNVRVDYAPAASVVPRSWWRGVSSSFTLFAKECFIDELARLTGEDPLAFRLRLLADGSDGSDGSGAAGRLRGVLRLAADRAGWGAKRSDGHALGLACRAGESCIAQVAEVSVDVPGRVTVHRVVNAVDCGLAVNPDGVAAMVEGGVNFALTATLSGEITLKDGAVEQSNFHDYRVLRFPDAPAIETHIVPSTAAPGGVGELATMALPAAVANAVFAATGVRVRRLPIGDQLKGWSARAAAAGPPRTES